MCENQKQNVCVCVCVCARARARAEFDINYFHTPWRQVEGNLPGTIVWLPKLEYTHWLRYQDKNKNKQTKKDFNIV